MADLLELYTYHSLTQLSLSGRYISTSKTNSKLKISKTSQVVAHVLSLTPVELICSRCHLVH